MALLPALLGLSAPVSLAGTCPLVVPQFRVSYHSRIPQFPVAQMPEFKVTIAAFPTLAQRNQVGNVQLQFREQVNWSDMVRCAIISAPANSAVWVLVKVGRTDYWPFPMSAPRPDYRPVRWQVSELLGKPMEHIRKFSGSWMKVKTTLSTHCERS